MTASPSLSPKDGASPGASADDSSIWGVIQALEHIVEALPEDVSALESLAVAYDQAGDTAQAHQTLLRIADLAIRGGDLRRAEQIAADQLSKGYEDPQLVALRERIEEQRNGTGGGSGASQSDAAAGSVETSPEAPPGPEADLHAELDFGWLLLESEQITQDQYEKAVDALTEAHIDSQGRGPISFLLELATVAEGNVVRVLSFVSAEYRIPFIELRQCQISSEAVAGVGLDAMRRLCAIPFGVMGGERMVAVLNPANENLVRTLRRLAGERIHIYLANPTDFSETLEALSSQGIAE